MEGGDGDTARVAEREVGKAGQAGLVSVDDVEAVARERQLEVRAHADGNAEAAPAGNRNRGAERDDAFERGSGGAEPLQRAPAGGQLGRPSGRRQDDDLVASPAKLGGRARDVVVHRVRLRPGERGDHADPREASHSPILRLHLKAPPARGTVVRSTPWRGATMCLPGTAEIVRERVEAEGRPKVDRRTALLGAAGPARARGELPGERARERRSPAKGPLLRPHAHIQRGLPGLRHRRGARARDDRRLRDGRLLRSEVDVRRALGHAHGRPGPLPSRAAGSRPRSSRGS